jgi:hypothetical protein
MIAMFEKKEDKLFEYAFGDLDAHDAQIFEAALLKDDISAEEVKFLQSVKGDLISFRDIPEMQYSKERLRDAILGQGLKPSKPAFPWMNWILAPGALACTFAVGYVLMHGASRKNPVYISADAVAKNSVPPGLKLPKQDLKAPDTRVADKWNGQPTINSVASKGAFVDEVNVVPHRHSSKKAQHALAASSAVAVTVASKISAAQSGYVASVASLSGSVSSREPVKDTIETTSATAVDATMILINKDLDSGVGAPVATEVKDTTNVIVGG